MSDGMADAANMAATGVGLGILTMGALLPIKIMKKSLEDMEEKEDEKPKNRRTQKGVVLPKIRVAPRQISRKDPFEFDAPKIRMPDLKINYPTMKGINSKKWKF